jgi:hypothetical protein
MFSMQEFFRHAWKCRVNIGGVKEVKAGNSNAKFDPKYTGVIRRGRDASPRRPSARSPRAARSANAPYHVPYLLTTSTNVVRGDLPQQDAKMRIAGLESLGVRCAVKPLQGAMPRGLLRAQALFSSV